MTATDYELAIRIGTGSIAILNKGIEMIKAGYHGGVGDQAATSLGFDLSGDEYRVAATATLKTYLLGDMEGKDMFDPTNEVEAFERARDGIQQQVTLAHTELAALKAGADESPELMDDTPGDDFDDEAPTVE